MVKPLVESGPKTVQLENIIPGTTDSFHYHLRNTRAYLTHFYKALSN